MCRVATSVLSPPPPTPQHSSAFKSCEAARNPVGSASSLTSLFPHCPGRIAYYSSIQCCKLPWLFSQLKVAVRSGTRCPFWGGLHPACSLSWGTEFPRSPTQSLRWGWWEKRTVWPGLSHPIPGCSAQLHRHPFLWGMQQGGWHRKQELRLISLSCCSCSAPHSLNGTSHAMSALTTTLQGRRR